jgi:predicted lipoprotein with Yx(FWY)xxD motif
MRLSIKHSAAGTLAIGLAAVVLAACGGGDGNEGSGSGSAATMGTKAGVVSVSNVDNTKVLTDSQGRSLYSADVEKGGRIMCTSGCLSFWKPVDASSSQAKTAAADLSLDLGVVKRPGGARQLTFDGKPLYSFTQEGPGQLTGNGFVDDFHGTQFTWTAAATGGNGASSEPATSPY